MGKLVQIWIGLVIASLLGCSAKHATEPDILRLDRWVFESAVDSRDVELPIHLDDAVPHEPSTYSLTTDLELPADFQGRPLTLAVPHLLAHVELSVDGEPIPAMDATDPDAYRTLGPHRWRIPATHTAEPIVSLRLEVQSTWTQAAWLDSIPRLSTAPAGDPHFLRAKTLNGALGIFGFIALLLTGFAHAVVYLSARSRSKAAGLFTVEALGGATYPAFVCGLLEPVFGVYDGAVMGVGLILTTTANLYFVHEYCGLGPLSRRWWLVGALVASPYLFLGGPFVMTNTAALVTIAVMVANCVYQLVITARLLRRDEPAPVHLWIVPLAWPLANLLGLTDFASWLGLGEHVGDLRSGSLGIGLVALVQTIALSRQHVFALRRADRLNAELQRRLDLLQTKNAEVERLNQDLRRQIEGRSTDLAAALAKLESRDPDRDAWAQGAVIDERYEVLGALGQGGMGEVYLVQRLADGRELAVKRLKARGVADMARFAREAQIISKVSHPNVIAIEDVEVSGTRGMYLVMEYVEGGSLRTHGRDYPDLDWSLAVLRDVAAGLVGLHAQGVVHRDLKPSNILIVEGERPLAKLADFGISGFIDPTGSVPPMSATPPGDPAADTAPLQASHFDPNYAELDPDASPALTRSGVVFGTPRYMAPETTKMGARGVGSAADLYAFGLIALELLFGREPVAGVDPLAELRIGVLCEARPRLGEGVLRVLLQCLQREPEGRPSAEEVLGVLEPVEDEGRCSAPG